MLEAHNISRDGPITTRRPPTQSEPSDYFSLDDESIDPIAESPTTNSHTNTTAQPCRRNPLPILPPLVLSTMHRARHGFDKPARKTQQTHPHHHMPPTPQHQQPSRLRLHPRPRPHLSPKPRKAAIRPKWTNLSPPHPPHPPPRGSSARYRAPPATWARSARYPRSRARNLHPAVLTKRGRGRPTTREIRAPTRRRATGSTRPSKCSSMP